jgi:hypothetical protein
MVKLFEEEIHIMQLFYANQSIRNARDISNATHNTVYCLFADTPHKRTSPLNGHFLRDRQNMYGFVNKIFPLKRTP